MGINNFFKQYEEKNLKLLNINYNGLVWCELGNQDYYGSPAKKIYQLKGVDHTSIDINGKDGSLPLNLDLPVPENLENKFDVVTNYGTTEHVNNQYQVFKNIHDMSKKFGVMIHGIPLYKNWPNHCRFYYSKLFFEELSSLCNYKIIDISILDKDHYRYPNNLVTAVLIKNDVNIFITQDVFKKIKGLADSKDTKRTGNYTKVGK